MSATPPSNSRSPPHATGSSYRRATSRSPAGGTSSATSGSTLSAGSKPLSKRARSSAQYESMQKRAAALVGSAGATSTAPAASTRSTLAALLGCVERRVAVEEPVGDDPEPERVARH